MFSIAGIVANAVVTFSLNRKKIYIHGLVSMMNETTICSMTEWDFSNDKTHAERGFYFSADCKGQLSNFFVEDLRAIFYF